MTSLINLQNMEVHAIIRNGANDDAKRGSVYARKNEEGHL